MMQNAPELGDAEEEIPGCQGRKAKIPSTGHTTTRAGHEMIREIRAGGGVGHNISPQFLPLPFPLFARSALCWVLFGVYSNHDALALSIYPRLSTASPFRPFPALPRTLASPGNTLITCDLHI